MATIKIYTVTGRLIKTLGPETTVRSPNQSRIDWDGRDEDGDELANGVYLYKISAEAQTEDGLGLDSCHYFGKMMIHN